MLNNSSLSFKDIGEIFDKHENYIILTHSSPDGDTLGSAFALYYVLKAKGKKVCVLCPDEIPAKYGYFVCETDKVDSKDAYIIAVDVADPKLLGSYEQIYGDRIDLCIDHHISNRFYAKETYLESSASAACEVMYKLFEAIGYEINDTIAKALYTGIATDTGCFKYQNVTAQTHIIAAGLYKYNIEAHEINRIMFDTKTRNIVELEQMVLQTAEYHFDNKCMIISVTSEMQKKTGCSGPDLEGIAVISRSVEGVICGITVKQTDETTYKISLRTYDPLNASSICKILGGGGHKGAAGCTVEGTLDEVKAKILGAVKAEMEETNVGIFADQ